MNKAQFTLVKKLTNNHPLSALNSEQLAELVDEVREQDSDLADELVMLYCKHIQKGTIDEDSLYDEQIERSLIFLLN